MAVGGRSTNRRGALRSRARVPPRGRDLVIASYGNGLWMSLRAARRLEQETGAKARARFCAGSRRCRRRDVVEHARECGKLLVVDECRKTGNVSEALAAALLDAGGGDAIRAGHQRRQLHPARRRREPGTAIDENRKS
ncbi:MAG: hypothetical protein IPM13_16930 [Phycisphaerales bacterium]|nr:hypothetical protein [Phycisphaerales bacterium]